MTKHVVKYSILNLLFYHATTKSDDQASYACNTVTRKLCVRVGLNHRQILVYLLPNLVLATAFQQTSRTLFECTSFSKFQPLSSKKFVQPQHCRIVVSMLLEVGILLKQTKNHVSGCVTEGLTNLSLY